MTNNEKKSITLNNSKRMRAFAHETSQLPNLYQTVYQTVIPETPCGLIGEKVVYNEKYLKSHNEDFPVVIPENGYFTISKVFAENLSNGKIHIRVKLEPFPYGRQDEIIGLGNLTLYRVSE